jgi:hypothetical protein
MQCPFIHPYAYSIIILLFTIVTTIVFILLLLLSFCYCYYYKTVATDKLLRASLFLGAAELTTHLLRLINILWLPFCRINKFGFYFPRRLLRSPILVDHHARGSPLSAVNDAPWPDARAKRLPESRRPGWAWTALGPLAVGNHA